jgi:hypothetical protein
VAGRGGFRASVVMQPLPPLLISLSLAQPHPNQILEKSRVSLVTVCVVCTFRIAHFSENKFIFFT